MKIVRDLLGGKESHKKSRTKNFLRCIKINIFIWTLPTKILTVWRRGRIWIKIIEQFFEKAFKKIKF